MTGNALNEFLLRKSGKTWDDVIEPCAALSDLDERSVEQFLRDAGTSPAASSSRNPLEQPWTLAPQEFARRAPRADPQHFTRAQDETLELTERITKIEREIDERVAELYGVSLDKQD